jgi:hypothetical protein
VNRSCAQLARIALLAVGGGCSQPRAAVEIVGDPLGDCRSSPDEAFARNVWDLQVWDGRLYLGYGDAVENTGPTDVIAYDPTTREFVHEATLAEEAIGQYRVIGDRLFVPGVDAVESDDGALHVRDGSGWMSWPLPDVVHALDVAKHGGEICVAAQDRFVGGQVRCTPDDGATWRSTSTGGPRAVSLFELGGNLYVSSHGSGVGRVGGPIVAFDIPGVAADPNVLVFKPTPCGADVVFVARRVVYRERKGSATELGLFRASSTGTDHIAVTPIAIPGNPVDVFASEGRCYALTDLAQDRAAIYAAGDDGTWSARVTFGTDALARSAERLGGDFYVGLGCEPGACSNLAGRIVRIAVP